jgi:hypothetical protein
VDIPQKVKSILPKGENENLPKGQIQIDERVKSLTETTSKNTSKTTTNIPPTEKNESGFQNAGKVGSRILKGIKDMHKKTTDSPVTVESEAISSGLELVFALKERTDIQKQQASKILKDVPEHEIAILLITIDKDTYQEYVFQQ